MNKKIVSLTLALALLATATCFMTGCHEHVWTPATCTEPKTCSVCDHTEGEPLGHDLTKASCTEDSKCNNCDHIAEKAWGHTTGFGYCDRCLVKCTDKMDDFYEIINNLSKAVEYTSTGVTYANSNPTMAIYYLEQAEPYYTEAAALCATDPGFSDATVPLLSMSALIATADETLTPYSSNIDKKIWLKVFIETSSEPLDGLIAAQKEWQEFITA